MSRLASLQRVQGMVLSLGFPMNNIKLLIIIIINFVVKLRAPMLKFNRPMKQPTLSSTDKDFKVTHAQQELSYSIPVKSTTSLFNQFQRCQCYVSIFPSPP